MLKKYLARAFFLIIWGIFLSPLNTFAGTLTNISVVGDSNITSATTTYTVSFTTENTVPSGAFSAFQIAFDYNLGGNNFNFDSVQAGDVSLTINGVSRSISSVATSGNVLHIYPSGSISAWANLVFTIRDVVNPNAAWSYGFFDFRTRTTGTDPIDTGSPSPVIIVAPDTTAPIQSSIVVSPSKTSATISFTTNEAATSTFSYGPTSSYGTTVTISGSTATSHSWSIASLSNCGAVYHYQISTTDTANNTSTSTDATFVTHCGSTSGGGGYSAPLPENNSTSEETPASSIELNSASETMASNSAEVEKNIPEEKAPIIPPTPVVPPEEKILVHSAITTKPYITSYIKLGKNNNKDQVKRLQIFLNSIEGEHLVVDGVYKKVDAEAIKRFQKKYSQAILSYWKINKPTGYVYITTTEMINKLVREKIQK